MQFAGESRGFSEKEAVTLDRLLDVLSEYSAESVTWWPRAGDPGGDPGR
jgi:hypothetical protein